MFDFFENETNDNFFESCDIEMKEIDYLYNECEKLQNDHEIIKQKENDIYIIYVMFSVVLYMLLIGSNIKSCLKKNYIETLFPKPIEIYIDKLDNVNMLD